MADSNPFELADGQFALELYTDKAIMVRANRATITQYAGQLAAMNGMYKDNWRGYPGCMFPRAREPEIRQKIHMPSGYVQAKVSSVPQNYAQMLAAAQNPTNVVQAPSVVPLPNNLNVFMPSAPLATPFQPQGPRVLKNQELKAELETHADNYQETISDMNDEKSKELEKKMSLLEGRVFVLEGKCQQYQSQIEQLTTFCSGLSQMVQSLLNVQTSQTPGSTPQENKPESTSQTSST